jgi:hypothetical protein
MVELLLSNCPNCNAHPLARREQALQHSESILFYRRAQRLRCAPTFLAREEEVRVVEGHGWLDEEPAFGVNRPTRSGLAYPSTL